MKLNKQQETEAKKAYEVYFDSYIKGDITSIESMLENDYNQIGSAESEVFFNKKEAVKFLHDTIDQVAGQTEIRNRTIRIDPLKEYLLVTDLFDIYVMIDAEWSFYSKFRASTLMHKKEGVWKFVHQHSSVPDVRAQEGENIAIEKISKENLELRDAIKRRTLELEGKNRELEIETALEKVRSRSLAMHKSHELADLSLELVKQVQDLGIDTWFCAFNINDEDGKGSMEWGSNGQGTFPKYRTPREGIFLRYYRAGQRGEALFINEIDEKECPGHYAYLCSLPGVGEQLLKMKEDGISFPTSQIDHVAFFKYGYILFITFKPVPEAHDIFKRFAKIFEQTYTRFLDLQKAEAQAREAQIEVALERVRSRTMAMHHSDEFRETVGMFFEQLITLDFNIQQCSLSLIDHEKKEVESFQSTGVLSVLPKSFKFPIPDDPIVYKMIEDVLFKQDGYTVTTYEGEEKQLFDEYIFNNTPIQYAPREVIEFMRAMEKIILCRAHMKYGLLEVVNTEEPISNEKADILIRFAKVFEQTYTRFLDLKKAEAQAREAQIEAALEKVRSRSLAMHKSDDLKDVVAVVFEKLMALGFELEKGAAIILIFLKDSKDHLEWIADPAQSYVQCIRMPYFENPLLADILNGWKNGTNFYSRQYSFDVKNDFFSYTFEQTDYRHIPDVRKEILLKAEKYSYSIAFETNSAIGVPDATGKIFSEEKQELLTRFARVFEQAYTRFLDLQKAEAQAREAQIEASLEKVRSRSIGMQKSEELKEVIQVIHDQLILLDFEIDAAGFTLDYHQNNDWNIWIANKSESLPSLMHIPYTDHPQFNYYKYAKENGLDFLANTLSFEEKNSIFSYMFGFTGDYPETEKEELLSKPGLAISQAFLKNISLWIYNLDAVPYSEEDNSILMRFAKVFEQTYVRFNDLQKKEAQAREAQIEAALEKVRSRSLAMHKSEELGDMVGIVFKKLQELDFELDGAAFIGIPGKDSKDMNFWIADEKQTYPSCFHIPYYDSPVISDIWDTIESGKDFNSKIYSKEEKNHWFKYSFEHSDLKVLSKKRKKWILEQEFLTQSAALTKNSMVGIHCHFKKEFSEAEIDILKRFSNVFEQGYVRFLDLQKAEAQAREAQIEASLERVRSKAMAMHKSEELPEVATVLHNELISLNVHEFSQTSIIVHEEPSQKLIVWGARTGSGSLEKTVFPLLGDQVLQKLYDTWRQEEEFFTLKVEGKALRKHIEFVLPKASRTVQEDAAMKSMPDPTFFHCAFFCMGYLELMSDNELSEASSSLLVRFAKVFDQAYRRFLDLQKAEAQAREAQIEVALERVRAASMAMHKSEELPQVALVLLEQLEALGVSDLDCGINIVDPDTRDFIAYSAHSINESKQKKFHEFPKLNLHDFGFLRKTIERVDAGQMKFTLELKDELYKEIMSVWDKYGYPGLKNKKDFDAIGVIYLHVAQFNIYSSISTTSMNPFSEEKMLILERMAKTFGMSYTRFLDLQKAEAQAREAQIEAALERVRARTMAMQHSDELPEAANLLFLQIQSLGINAWSAGYNILEEDKKACLCVMSSEGVMQTAFRLPFTGEKSFREWHKAIKSEEDFFVQELGGKALEKHYEYLMKLPGVQEAVAPIEEAGFSLPKYQINHLSFFKHGFLLFITYERVPEAYDIFKRFTHVFEQTYARFLDLQKAEAQAREAQVEASLEKVRARSMGMQNSEELKGVIRIIFDQLAFLNINAEHAGIVVDFKAGEDWNFWVAETQDIPSRITVPYLDSVWDRQYTEAKKKGRDFFTTQMDFEEKNLFYKGLLKYIPGLTKKARKFYLTCPGLAISTVIQKDVGLYIENFSGTHYTDEENDILKRFVKVFQQTYTRFLDLQKAEEQAREAQVETALERVRSRTMAMHNSEELSETASVLFEQLEELGIEPWRSGIAILDEENRHFEVRSITSSGRSKNIRSLGLIKIKGNKAIQEIFKAWKQQFPFLKLDLKGEKLKSYLKYISSYISLPEMDPASKNSPDRLVYYHIPFAQGTIYGTFLNPIQENQIVLLQRFTKVFAQTYTRYLDLKKAEAQAWEAKIETALERVRASSMAMHKSEELPKVALTFMDQIEELDIPTLGVTINIINPEEESYVTYFADNTQKGKKRDINSAKVYHIDAFWISQESFRRMKSGEKEFTLVAKGEKLSLWIDYIEKYWSKKRGQRLKSAKLKKAYFHNFEFHDFSTILFSTLQPLHEEYRPVIRRLIATFKLSYLRFLDLKKAEAQAREAQIEAALERVRGKAMAMHNSDDLNSAIRVFHDELVGLSLTNIIRCGAGIVNKDTRIADISTVNKSSAGEIAEVRGKIDMAGHPLLQNVFDHWLKKDEYHHVLRGNEIKKYYQYMRSHVAIPDYPDDAIQYFYFPMFTEGSFYIITEKELSEQELIVFRRFTSVLSLTYKRYKDLMDAEARALIAVREASLDRVRAEIASMRHANDLERITPLIWRELLALGVPFFRCGVMIVVEKEKKIHFYLSTPEGKSLAALHLDFDGIELARKGVDHWRRQEVYLENWNKEQFIESMKGLMEQGQVQNAADFQGGAEPPESLALQFVPFPQGMLYVGSAEPLTSAQIELVGALAEAFSVAYARYEDFTKLEEAKTQVEHTLKDLRSTQTQLVQAEKMASLGELTAGIAHEIQNPLNFVNNFSEVSGELVDEMKEEIEAENLKELNEIAGDLRQNLDKINHHGQRASEIVKGMLQHSRTGTGQKEPTDINAMADEYLRLAYHGLRAKDKSFNADFHLDLDKNLPKIQIIPQDIGRVLLNLINNAFYASASKASYHSPEATDDQKATEDSDYKPLVTITTKKLDDMVEIKVKDNGPGIPEEIREKIFQPFFTTKPTGQGTGLGLSLSYDIVTKGHRGTIDVISKVGKGTEFIVKLPETIE